MRLRIRRTDRVPRPRTDDVEKRVTDQEKLHHLQKLADQTRDKLGTADLANLDYEALFHDLLLELERVLNTPPGDDG